MLARPRSSRSRSALAWGMLFSTAIVIAVEIGAPPWKPDHVDPLYAVRRDRMQQRLQTREAELGARPPLVVAFGSSRVLCGLNCGVVEATVRESGREICLANFGCSGSGPYQSLMMLGRLLKDGIVPDVVLVEAYPPFFDAARSPASLLMTGHYRLLPEDCRWLKQVGISIPEPQERRDPDCSLAAYRGEILNRLAPCILPRLDKHDATLNEIALRTDAWGSLLPAGEFSHEKRETFLRRVRAGMEAEFGNVVWGDLGFQALEALLAECRKHRISAFIMLMPDGPQARAWFRPGSLDELEQQLAELAREYDAELVAGGQWIDGDKFGDAIHLSASGVHEFAVRFGERKLAPWLSRQERLAEVNKLSEKRVRR